MLIARLLTVFLLCSAFAFAQKQSDSSAGPTQVAEGSKSTDITSSEPWRILPREPADAVSSEKNSADRLGIGPSKMDQNKIDQNNKVEQFRIGPNGRPFKSESPDSLVSRLEKQDNTCYAIRSYVVARDGKNSDSTHPVNYSTCQPSSRYHVKSAEAHAPADR
jgi:hypothetical protein